MLAKVHHPPFSLATKPPSPTAVSALWKAQLQRAFAEMAFYATNTCRSVKKVLLEPSNGHRRQMWLVGRYALLLPPSPHHPMPGMGAAACPTLGQRCSQGLPQSPSMGKEESCLAWCLLLIP